jgi:Ribbon-helix-helix domain
MKNQSQPKMFSTRVNADLIKELKHLSVDLEKPIAQLVEEALMDLIKKYQAKRGYRP